MENRESCIVVGNTEEATMNRRVFLVESIAGIGGLVIGGKLLADTAQEKTDTIRFTGTLIKADVVNGNECLYPREVLEKEVARFNADYKTYIALPSGLVATSTAMFGQIGMPSNAMTDLNQISHFVTDLRMEGDYLVADINALDTPNGRTLKSILNNAPDSIALRTAGIGRDFLLDEDFVLQINNSYRLTSVNVVSIYEASSLERK